MTKTISISFFKCEETTPKSRSICTHVYIVTVLLLCGPLRYLVIPQYYSNLSGFTWSWWKFVKSCKLQNSTSLLAFRGIILRAKLHLMFAGCSYDDRHGSCKCFATQMQCVHALT